MNYVDGFVVAVPTANREKYLRFAQGNAANGKPQAQNPSTWLAPGTSFTNNVQAQLGVSVFLPFSWEYRLPK